MSDRLAIAGGNPVRANFLAYGRQTIEEEDIAAVVEALRSDWLTTGPRVEEFEEAFRAAVGAGHAVAVNSGTAALHAAMAVLDIGPGDEVIVPAMTFAASATCVLMQGATPVFADVDPDTLLVRADDIQARLTKKTKAVITVDFAGQPANYDDIGRLCTSAGLHLVADAAHSLGGKDRGGPVGTLADLTTFSLHPVKHITSGEGGVVTTQRRDWADRIRDFRNHGITSDHRHRAQRRDWRYEIHRLGYNYRLTDFQSALATSQLRRLPRLLSRRRELADRYSQAFAKMPAVAPLQVRQGVDHAYHLYVVRIDADRQRVFEALRAEGIGVNVHYQPVHLQPLFRRLIGTAAGLCPVVEREYERLLTLPLFPGMTDRDADDVIAAVGKVLAQLG